MTKKKIIERLKSTPVGSAIEAAEQLRALKAMDAREAAGMVQGLGLSALTRFAASDIPDELGIRETVEEVLYKGSKASFGFLAKQRPKSGSKSKPLTEADITRKKKGLFDLSLTDDQQMMRDMLRAFARDIIRPAAHDADSEHAAPFGLLEQIDELGIIYHAIPETVGGTDMGGMAATDSTVSQMLAFEDLGFGDFSLAVAALTSVSVANVIRRYGTDAQKQRYLPEFLVAENSETGKKPLKATLATLEGVPLFDAQKLSTTVKKSGGILVLSGEKCMVPMAKQSDILVVSAMYMEKPELFVVPTNATGVSFTDAPAMGLKAAQTQTVRFDAVHLLATDKLNANYDEFLDLSRLATAAIGCGVGDAVLDYVIPYVNEREAFGEPISHRQSVAFMVSDIAIELESVRMLVWRAAARAQNGLPFHREAHLAHILASKKLMKIGTDSVQLLGGHGYTKEHPVERWYRDLRSVAVLHGSLCI